VAASGPPLPGAIGGTVAGAAEAGDATAGAVGWLESGTGEVGGTILATVGTLLSAISALVIILLLSGVFSLIQGFVALVGSNYYYAVENGTLFLFDLTGWGWWNLIIGALLVLTGIFLFTGATWARVVAVRPLRDIEMTKSDSRSLSDAWIAAPLSVAGPSAVAANSSRRVGSRMTPIAGAPSTTSAIETQNTGKPLA